MLIKQKSLRTFGRLPLVFSTKVNLLYLLCSVDQRRCFLHLIKQNCLPKTFLRTLILMTQLSLYLFSLLNLKLHNISVTLKMVKKAIMNLDLSKASGLDCTSLVVLKSCEPELYILAEAFIQALLSTAIFFAKDSVSLLLA